LSQDWKSKNQPYCRNRWSCWEFHKFSIVFLLKMYWN
jgi:hypothetical protein